MQDLLEQAESQRDPDPVAPVCLYGAGVVRLCLRRQSPSSLAPPAPRPASRVGARRSPFAVRCRAGRGASGSGPAVGAAAAPAVVAAPVASGPGLNSRAGPTTRPLRSGGCGRGRSVAPCVAVLRRSPPRPLPSLYLANILSGGRDSNPRPKPWQGGVFRRWSPLHAPTVHIRPPSFHTVYPIRRCSRALYYQPRLHMALRSGARVIPN